MKSIVVIWDIYLVNFRTFDLNLLRVLDAMLATRNTTRAGEAIGLSQPAVSAALGRLRDLLGDPLFVREGNSLVQTPFALSLQEPMRAALVSLEATLSGGGAFDLENIDRSFVIGASDYFQETLMPTLAATVARTAPNVRLKMLPAMTETFPAMLTADRFDMVLSIAVDTPNWIEREPAFRASALVVARKDHPLFGHLRPGEPFPLELYCTLPHAMFSVTEGFTHLEDQALSLIGRERPVAVAVPGYFGVARIVAQSNLLGVLPMRFARSLAGKLGLNVYRLPFEMPLVELFLYWRKRDTSGREHAWLRRLILDILAPLDEIRFPVADAELAKADAQ